MAMNSFTFLATILILVLFSASLVLRSYILCWRYRPRFQQALADSGAIWIPSCSFTTEPKTCRVGHLDILPTRLIRGAPLP